MIRVEEQTGDIKYLVRYIHSLKLMTIHKAEGREGGKRVVVLRRLMLHNDIYTLLMDGVITFR